MAGIKSGHTSAAEKRPPDDPLPTISAENNSRYNDYYFRTEIISVTRSLNRELRVPLNHLLLEIRTFALAP